MVKNHALIRGSSFEPSKPATAAEASPAKPFGLARPPAHAEAGSRHLLGAAGSRSGQINKVVDATTAGTWRSTLAYNPHSNRTQKQAPHPATAAPALYVFFFPASLWGSCFLCCIPPPASASASAAPLSPTHLTPLISHNSSHTQLNSHTTHLTHSSHPQLISFISYTTHLTQLLISHHSSHVELISHNSSDTTHLTQLISHNSSHRRVAWQAQYTEPPEGAAARIVAGWAAAALCVAGAVHRGS